MKEQDEFEPLIIKGNQTLTDPSTRLAIAKQTVKAIEFACDHRLKYIIAWKFRIWKIKLLQNLCILYYRII